MKALIKLTKITGLITLNVAFILGLAFIAAAHSWIGCLGFIGALFLLARLLD